MKISKCVLLITAFVVYILIGITPWFRIKLAPLVEMSEFNGMAYYFYHNFINNWGFKVIAALTIATIVSLIIREISARN